MLASCELREADIDTDAGRPEEAVEGCRMSWGAVMEVGEATRGVGVTGNSSRLIPRAATHFVRQSHSAERRYRMPRTLTFDRLIKSTLERCACREVVAASEMGLGDQRTAENSAEMSSTHRT